MTEKIAYDAAVDQETETKYWAAYLQAYSEVNPDRNTRLTSHPLGKRLYELLTKGRNAIIPTSHRNE